MVITNNARKKSKIIAVMVAKNKHLPRGFHTLSDLKHVTILNLYFKNEFVRAFLLSETIKLIG